MAGNTAVSFGPSIDLSLLPTKVEVDAIVDPHLHFREGKDVMMSLMNYSFIGGAEVFGPMPNTDAGLITAEDVLSYRDLCRTLLPEHRRLHNQNGHFIPIMMLTPNTTIEQLDHAARMGIKDVKVYPLGRTTKSHNGVRHYAALLPLVKRCGEVGIRVHFHPEHPLGHFINRDAEYQFLAIVDMFLYATNATIVWEHGTDGRCIPFWKEFAKTGRFYVTLTAHHLVGNEDSTFGDVRATCKPPLKTEYDRSALVLFVGEGHSWVMAGSDSAYHDVSKKHVEVGCCACGAVTAPFLHSLYAQGLQHLFVTSEGINTYRNFTSRYARRLYGLPPATIVYTLKREPFAIPLRYSVGEKGTALSFWGGQTLDWSLG